MPISDRQKRLRVGGTGSLLEELKRESEQRRAQRASRVSALISRPPKPPAKEPDLQGLFQEDNLDQVREQLGLPPDVDLEFVFRNPDLAKRMSPALWERAQELYKGNKTPPPMGAPTATPEPQQAPDYVWVPAPAKPPSWREPKDDISTEYELFGAPFLKYDDADVEPGSVYDFLRRVDPIRAVQQQTREIIHHYKTTESQPGDIRDFVGRVNTQMDLQSQTTADVLGMPWDWVRGRPAQAPTILAEGQEATLEKFREKPAWEQLALGLVDPFIVYGIAKDGWIGARSVARYTRLRVTAAGQAERASAKVVRQQVQQRALREVGVPTFPLQEDIEALVRPRTTAGPGVLGVPRRLADPSTEIMRHAPGSEERTILQSVDSYGKLKSITQGYVSTLMHRIENRADVNKLFDISTKMGDEPLARAVTKDMAGNDLPKAPYAGNVFERPDRYTLTDEQREWITFVHKLNANILKYAQAEGVDVKELGAADELFYYFPRRVVDPRTKKAHFEFSRVNGSRPTQHRALDEMIELGSKSGGAWEGPKEALRSYYTSMYNEIARKRLQTDLQPLAKKKEVPPWLLERQARHKSNLKKMDQTIRDTKAMDRGFLPSAQTVKAMKRRFPDLAGRIDTVMSLKPQDIDKIVREVSKQTLEALRISPARLRQAMLEVQSARALGDKRAVYQRDIVSAAATRLGLDGQKRGRMIRDVTIQAERQVTRGRKAEIYALVRRMEDYRATEYSRTGFAARDARAARSRARKAGIGEVPAPSVHPTAIFDRAVAERLEEALAPRPESRGIAAKTWRFLVQGVSQLRLLRTAFDLGTPLTLGLPTLAKDPQGWAKATKIHIHALLDPRVRSRYVAENATEIVDYLKHGGTIGSTEFTEAVQNGGWLASLPTQIESSGRIPGAVKRVAAGVPRTIHIAEARFSNSFDLFLDASRVEVWRGLKSIAKSEDELHDLATFVNQLTGVVNPRAMGVPTGQSEFESTFAFFAPRYTRAMAALTMDTMRGGLRGEQARNSFARLFMGILSIHVAMAHMLQQEPRIDPTQPEEFLGIDVAGQRIRPGGKMLSFFKMFADISETAAKNPEGFMSWPVLSEDSFRENPLLKAFRYQTSPLTTNLINVLTGSDPIGRAMPGLDDPIDLAQYFGQQTLPFWAAAAAEQIWEQGGPIRGAAAGGAAEFGGLSSHPIPNYTKLDELYDQYAREDYGKPWEHVKKDSAFAGRTEKREMLQRHPDLNALQETVNQEQRERPTMKRRFQAQDQITQAKITWADALNQAARNFDLRIDGRKRGESFREAYKVASQVRRRVIEQVRRDYPDVYEELDEYYEELAEEFPLIQAEQKFFDALTSTTDEGGVLNPGTGRTNYAAMREFKQSLNDEFGPGTMAAISKELEAQRFTLRDLEGNPVQLDPRAVEYLESHLLLEPYWEAYRTVLPPEQWSEWEYFNQAPEDTKMRMRVQENFGQMEGQVARAQYEVASLDPAIDMALVLFFDRAPRNRENQRWLAEEMRRRSEQWFQPGPQAPGPRVP